MFLLSISMGAARGGIEAYQEKSLTPILEATGGKILGIDVLLKEEINLLQTSKIPTNETVKPSFVDMNKIIKFDLILNLIMLIVLIILTFKFGLWLSGKFQVEPLAQICIILISLALFAFLEFLYSLLVLKQTIIPFEGIWRVITNYQVLLT